jgi:hypothetical protein
MSAEIAINVEGLESALIQGDLSKLTAAERSTYYLRVCESVGLNPLTRPFIYLLLGGKTVLYANRDCTDQLRKVHSVTIKIEGRETIEGVHIVTAAAVDKTGRGDVSTGAVNIKGLAGEGLANAFMKAETKAKRRVTLSICGLGMLDETELQTIPDAVVVHEHDLPAKPPQPKPAPLDKPVPPPPVATLTDVIAAVKKIDMTDGGMVEKCIARVMLKFPEICEPIGKDDPMLTDYVAESCGLGDQQEWPQLAGPQLITAKAAIVQWLEMRTPKTKPSTEASF